MNIQTGPNFNNQPSFKRLIARPKTVMEACGHRYYDDMTYLKKLVSCMCKLVDFSTLDEGIRESNRLDRDTIYREARNRRVLPDLEKLIKSNKSLQEYAKEWERYAEIHDLPRIDLIVEYDAGKIGEEFHRDHVQVNMFDTKNNFLTPIAFSYGCGPTDEQVKKYACSKAIKKLRELNDAELTKKINKTI